jgi:hypothetical protein
MALRQLVEAAFFLHFFINLLFYNAFFRKSFLTFGPVF